MPRKKIPLKPANKQMPKTTGILLTGSCGHSYKERFAVPYEARGDVSGKTLAAMTEFKTMIVREALRRECKDCVARADIATSKTRTDLVENFLSLPGFSFPRMDNTPRMAAFAESVRQETIHRNILTLLNEISGTLNKDSLINTLMISAFKKSWESDFIENAAPSPEILALIDKYKKFREEFLNYRQSQDPAVSALASWLILRHHFENDRRYGENRSKIWISATRKYLGYDWSAFSAPEIKSSAVLSAVLVASINTWEDLDDAWNAFQGLSQRYRHDFSDFVSTEIKSGTTLKDTIEGVQVARALIGNDKRDSWSWDSGF